MKSVRIRSFSGRYFSAFELNMGRYVVSCHIQSKCGKVRTRKITNTDTFYAVYNLDLSQFTKISQAVSVKIGSTSWVYFLKHYFLHFSPCVNKYLHWCDSVVLSRITAQIMKISIKNFFSKYDQIRRKLRIWPHLPKKSLIEKLQLLCCELILKKPISPALYVFTFHKQL